MNRSSKRPNRISKSTIALALLKWGDSFGYEIGFNVKRVMLRENKGSNTDIYPLLKKLEKEKLIRSFWRIEDGVKPRRYYSILAKGIALLEMKKEEADILKAEFRRLLNPYLLFPIAEDELQPITDTEGDQQKISNDDAG